MAERICLSFSIKKDYSEFNALPGALILFLTFLNKNIKLSILVANFIFKKLVTIQNLYLFLCLMNRIVHYNKIH